MIDKIYELLDSLPENKRKEFIDTVQKNAFYKHKTLIQSFLDNSVNADDPVNSFMLMVVFLFLKNYAEELSEIKKISLYKTMEIGIKNLRSLADDIEISIDEEKLKDD